MKKIFCLPRRVATDSESAIKRIFAEYFNRPAVDIIRGESGKPFLKDTPFFISVSHTSETLFIGVCDENIGLDAELQSREINYSPIIKKFSTIEREEIQSAQDFLRHWVVKESAVKWLGGRLSQDLYKLRYEKNKLFYGEVELPVQITLLNVHKHYIGVCSERDFSDAETIILQ